VKIPYQFGFKKNDEFQTSMQNGVIVTILVILIPNRQVTKSLERLLPQKLPSYQRRMSWGVWGSWTSPPM
jgi:hypothetical protein